ncbi:MAG: hypothetical protein HY074_14855 [Deltaproteobacteria bacterium]|nr:hypothetical protein [Deltaproteobacteria bacterium]
MAGRSILVMSCDDAGTFWGRIDLAEKNDQLEYMKVAPLLGAADSNGTDLSRIMGPLGVKSRNHVFDQVVVDDVDLIIDLRSEEAAVASMFTLLYALKARFNHIGLFSNPLRSDVELEYLTRMCDFLTIHGPSPQHQQNVA